jgi:hypothetical protein
MADKGDSRGSIKGPRTAGIGAERKLGSDIACFRFAPAAAIRTSPLSSHDRWSSSAFASLRSPVAKPSVNCADETGCCNSWPQYSVPLRAEIG